MLRFLFIAILSTGFFPGSPSAQFTHKIDSLLTIYNEAASDSDKVMACGKLAEYYYIYQLEKEGDSFLHKQLEIAEASNNKSLVFTAYFGNAVIYISDWARKECFEKALQYVHKGLDYSRTYRRDDYVTLSHIRLATLFRKRGDLDSASWYADRAFTISQNINNDSIKILAAIEHGDVSLAKDDLMLAFESYTKVFQDAVESENIFLQSEMNHRFSDLYRSLQIKDDPTSKKYLFRSLEQNLKYANGEGLIKDYIGLAKLTDERLYIDKALSLSDSLNLENYFIQAKGLMYGYYTVVVSNSDSTLKYLSDNPDLTQTWKNIGMPFYYMNIGSVYNYAGKWDSAIYYLQLAMPGYEKDFNEKNRRTLYEEIAQCYSSLQKPEKAIEYFEKALDLNMQFKNWAKALINSDALSALNGQTKDYKKAFYYSRLSVNLKNNLEKLANDKDITLIQLKNEEKRHEKELQEIADHKLTLRNLQYWAISISITGLFFLLIILGMLPVSKVTVKLLGYIAFISLFEFIILLIDPILKDITHEEPLMTWLIKIFLIALLVPMQHYLEHGIIRFFETRKKKNISFMKKWWQQQKKPTVATIETIEEDTAI